MPSVKRTSTSSSSSFSFRIFGCVSCGRSPPKKHLHNGVNSRRSMESDNNGEDFCNADSCSVTVPEHLVIMVNGIVGSAANWRYAAKQFVKRLPDKVFVHCSERNAATMTFDGIDLMGNRLAEEVKNIVESKQGFKKISFVGHSLGGLVARYAIGVLYEPPTEYTEQDVDNLSQDSLKEPKGKIAGLEPINFITFATPHLGSIGHKQLPFLCGFSLLEKAASQSAHWFVGRTGKHLFLTDKDDGERPLLLRMVTDCGDRQFMSALRSFKRRVAYSNMNYDHMVGWETSSIRRHHELPKLENHPLDERYPHILHVENEHHNEILQSTTTSINGCTNDAMEEEMLTHLSDMPWERVDVSFQGSSQRFLAHSTIQVKWAWMREGSDVIFHMIDNFVV